MPHAMKDDNVMTNSIRKEVASLGSVKGRRNTGCFVAEGTKCVFDTLDAFKCRYLFATAAWIGEHGHKLPAGVTPVAVSRADIERMSQLRTPQDVLAVYEIAQTVFDPAELSTQLTLALDGVQDPGNLGTIMRVADWFGVTTILCSQDTVDVYNPKVVQATMGAISRVKVIYCDLAEVLQGIDVPVYGTFLDGENIYSSGLAGAAVIVMGNEGNGISPEVADVVSRRLLIPSYPSGRTTSESLNVAMATGLTVAEFRRRTMK